MGEVELCPHLYLCQCKCLLKQKYAVSFLDMIPFCQMAFFLNVHFLTRLWDSAEPRWRFSDGTWSYRSAFLDSCSWCFSQCSRLGRCQSETEVKSRWDSGTKHGRGSIETLTHFHKLRAQMRGRRRGVTATNMKPSILPFCPRDQLPGPHTPPGSWKQPG